MSFTVEKLPDEPILIMTLPADFDPATELRENEQQVRAALDAADQPIFYITDMRDAHFAVSDMIAAANQGARGQDPTLKHPNIRQMIVVTGRKLIEMSARGLKSVTFGSISVEVFDTLDAALAYARAEG